MSNNFPLIAIVGRANVGKSTLFNLLADQEVAIVADQPGVTRDRNYMVLNNYKHPFCLVDTGGLLGEAEIELADAVQEQTEVAIEEADLIIAMFDGKTSLHPQDKELVRLLRDVKKPVLWVANKCEKEESQLEANQFYSLGIDELEMISAAHNQGIRQLIKKVWEKLHIDDQAKVKGKPRSEAIKIAVLGKPNAGKSTLVNRIIGEERQITSSIAGTTRDSVNIEIKRDGQEFVLVDTAGLRKQRNIKRNTLEKLFSFRTLRAIATCDVVVLVVDATDGPPSDQDAKIADIVTERGKGLMIAVNKWDAVEKDHRTSKEYKDSVREELAFCKYAPVVFVSALTGRRCPSILKVAKDIYDSGNQRISTADFNKMIETAVQKNSPPIYRGQPIKFYFATQIKTNPPTFVLFFNNPRKVAESYLRYLKNYVRAQHEFLGYNIKFITRQKTNRGAARTQEDSNTE